MIVLTRKSFGMRLCSQMFCFLYEKTERQFLRSTVYEKLCVSFCQVRNDKSVMIQLQVHIQLPCYDFYFLQKLKFGHLSKHSAATTRIAAPASLKTSL